MGEHAHPVEQRSQFPHPRRQRLPAERRHRRRRLPGIDLGPRLLCHRGARRFREGPGPPCLGRDAGWRQPASYCGHHQRARRIGPTCLLPPERAGRGDGAEQSHPAILRRDPRLQPAVAPGNRLSLHRGPAHRQLPGDALQVQVRPGAAITTVPEAHASDRAPGPCFLPERARDPGAIDRALPRGGDAEPNHGRHQHQPPHSATGPGPAAEDGGSHRP